MGDFVNGRWTKTMGVLGVIVMLAADGALVYTVATMGLP
jgi:hypothetical protein